jgi:hypothetical protein
MKFNKKAEMNTLLLLFLIVTSIIVANKVGLFSTFMPTTPDTGKLSPYINLWYYDIAVQQGTTWECAEQETVIFRTNAILSDGETFSDYKSGTWVALDIDGDNQLEGLGYSSTGSTAITCTQYPKLLSTSSGLYVGLRDIDTIYICQGTSSLAKYYKIDDSNACLDENTCLSEISLESYKSLGQEVSGGISSIKDAGKFTCENNNVVKKFCNYKGATPYPSDILNSCQIPCLYLAGQTVDGGVTADIVKCGGDYKPNINVCSSDSTKLYTTNSAGTLSSTICGLNGYNVCSNGACVNCKEGTSWCNGNTPMDCTGGQAISRGACTGLSTCAVTGSSPDTLATCNPNYPISTERCNLKQPQTFDGSTNTFINKGGECRNDCVLNNGIAECTHECTQNQYNCDDTTATLYKCEINSLGNKWIFLNGESINSQCLSGSCVSDSACAPKYNLGWEYCGGTTGKQRQKAITDSSGNLLSGGTTKENLPYAECNIACIEDNGNPQRTTCQPLSQCVNNFNKNVCKTTLIVGTCNSVGDAFTNEQNCQATNPRGFCNGNSIPAFCDIKAAECAGNYGCSINEGKIYACDSNGYFTLSNVLEICNNLGCNIGIDTIPSSINSQCNDRCTSSGYGCSNGKLFTCTNSNVNDIDGIQKIKSTEQSCTTGTCKDSSSCNPIKSLGTYCNNNILKQIVEDDSKLIDGKVREDTLATCNIGCDTQSNIPPLAECRQGHIIGTYCNSNELWQSVEDLTNVANGKTSQSKVADCILGCETKTSTFAQCKGERNSPGTFCKGYELWEAVSDPSAVSTGGIRTTRLLTCNNGCRGIDENNADCVPIRENTGTYCNGNDLWQSIRDDSAKADGYIRVSKITTCEEQCITSSSEYASCLGRSPGKYCVGTKELWEAVSDPSAVSTGGIRKTKIVDCTVGCEGVGAIDAKCTQVHIAGTYCDGKSLYEAVTDSSQTANGGIRISKLQDCNVDCSITSDTEASCVNQCTGITECIGGSIMQCNSGIIGNKLYTCGDLKCNEKTNGDAECTNLCSLEQPYTCVNNNAYTCEKNITTNQNVKILYQECGLDGCGSDGRCVSTNNPNSFICRGEALHSTDANGFPSTNPLFICNTLPSIEGLNAYCSEGFDKCKYCELNQYRCGTKELYQCGDPFIASKINVQSCEAGCFVISNNYNCDQLGTKINSPQNFFNNEDIIIVGILKGSKTQGGIVTSYSAKIEDAGFNILETKTGSSDLNGNFNINLGRRDLGTYRVTLTLPEFNNREFIISTKVSNDYKIKIFGEQVLILKPGLENRLKVEAKDSNGNAPASVIVSSSNITAEIIATSIASQWDLKLSGLPGTYDIGLKAVSGGVPQDEQFVTVELIKPILEIKTNMPSSIVKGKHTYDINVLGASIAIKPDNITATISHSPAESLTLLDLGAGKYTFEYDFIADGTYVLNVNTEKSGYTGSTFSQSSQVSTSGTTPPPGTNNQTTGGTGTTVTTPTLQEQIIKYKWYIIGGLILFVFRKKLKKWI